MSWQDDDPEVSVNRFWVGFLVGTVLTMVILAMVFGISGRCQ